MKWIWVAAVLVAVSCRQSTAPATRAGFQRALPATLTIPIGETVVYKGVLISFERVLEDSRCPIDVVCVWSGNAAVELGVGPTVGGEGPTHHLVLNSDHGPREGEAWNLRITLDEVRPAPVSTDPIPPDAYAVVIGVHRIGTEQSSRAERTPSD